MILHLFRKKKELTFSRTYPVPISAVWKAWTDPGCLREWWGPENTAVRECEVDLRIGGRIYIVMEAGEAMGKYQGTRWPLEGTFTQIEPERRLVYQARSWTEGEEATSCIQHSNEIELSEDGSTTTLELRITIHEISPALKAKLAAFGMKWGYKAQLEALEAFLAR